MKEKRRNRDTGVSPVRKATRTGGTPVSRSAPSCTSILAFGAHPDDIEFGAGAIVYKETKAGRPAHFVVCSRGEAGSNGTPEQRTREAGAAAKILGASIEFIELDGDAHLEVRAAHAIKLAEIIRRIKPAIVLAPTPHENQHPDHAALSRIVQNATRLARYGGLAELRDLPPHKIGQLFYYGATADLSAPASACILVDVSAPDVMDAWRRSILAHASQAATRDYLELILSRAKLTGMQAGVEHAIALCPNDPILVESLGQVCRGTKRF
jgi:LmbE family N-acetylglucosaminyl deacetylase